VMGEIRGNRYQTLRSVIPSQGEEIGGQDPGSEELRTVVLPPQAWGVGRTLDQIREQGADVTFTAIRRHGITGRHPDGALDLRVGDMVVIYGTPEALEHAEAVLLAG